MTFLAKAKPYFLLVKSRAEMASYTWFMLVGGFVASRGFIQVFPTILAAISVFLIAICVYIYNDVIDADMDRLNPKKKRRPIPSGKASKKEAMRLVYLTAILGITISMFLKIEVFAICLSWLVLFLTYSHPKIRLKNKTIIKEATPPIGTFLCMIIGALVNGSIPPSVLFAAGLSAGFIFFSLPAFRDSTDVKEDKMFGVKSLATILSWKRRLEMVILCVLAIMTLTPLTYMNFGFNVIFPIIIVAMSLIILRFLFPLTNRLEQINIEKGVKYVASYFFISQIFMVIASLQIFPLPFAFSIDLLINDLIS